ncbi:MAG: class A beta-lactamase-related serine hydrolase [Armatimonadetes bacterium]|nr:class A beta-lactamase-related serine hydrolase [Armatimonadota bacterium]
MTAPKPTSPSSFAADATRQIMARFEAEKLKADEFAWTLIDLQDAAAPAIAGYRPNEPIYPASVVKLFYLAAAHSQLESAQLYDTPELRRAMRDMIVDSSNDATALVLDMLTGTTGGPELSPEEFAVWAQKRNGVNRYFAGLGFERINVNQKPWNEGPYGRERQFLGPNYQNRNKLTTAAMARLLSQIARRQWVSPARSDQMRELLKRDPRAKESEDSQVSGFIGAAIRDIPGAAQWSKAGWTSMTRHDAAYVELPISARFPRGARFVLVIFTSNHAPNTQMLPAMARLIIDEQFGIAPAPVK